MTEGMPQLIAAEIDSYDQVLQRAIKAEQELAAANDLIVEPRGEVAHIEGRDGNCLACGNPWFSLECHEENGGQW